MRSLRVLESKSLHWGKCFSFFRPKFCVSPNSKKFDVSCEKPNICVEGNSRLVHTGKQTVQKRRKSFDDYFIFGDAAYFDMTVYCSFWKAELLHSSTVSEGRVLRPLDWNRSLQWVLQEKPNWQTKNKQLMLAYLGGQGCRLQTLCRWAGFKFHWHSDCWTTELSADVTHWYTVFWMPIRKYEFR